MQLLQLATAAATLLTGLVGGIVLVFAVVVMPGLAGLPDRDFLRAFQKIDGVVQAGQPLFMTVWLGSAAVAVAAAGLGFAYADRATACLLFVAAAAYLGGVQLPTGVINIPLNNRVQAIDLGTADDADVAALRVAFEGPWNRANNFRTVIAVACCATFAAAALRL